MIIRCLLFLILSILFYACGDSQSNKKTSATERAVSIKDSSSLYNFISSLSQMEFNRIYSGDLKGDRIAKWENALVAADPNTLNDLRNAKDNIMNSEFTLTYNYRIPDSINVVIMKKELYGGNFHFTLDSTVYLGMRYKKLSKREITKLLIHEIAHIISRYNPEFRRNIYTEKGFLMTENLNIPDSISTLIRSNPDLPSHSFVGKLPSMLFTTLCTLKNKGCRSYSECSECEIYKVEKSQNDSFILRNKIAGKHRELLSSRYSDYSLSEIHPEEILAEYMTDNITH